MTPRAGRSTEALGTHPRGVEASHRVELIPLSRAILMFDPANEKTHALDGIKESLRQHGLVEPPVVDERTGYFGAGHGRVEALAEMWEAKEPVPPRVVDADGEWLLPVLREAHVSADDLDAAHYRVASNGLGPAGGYDRPKLADVLSRLKGANNLAGTGFTAGKLDELLASMPRTEAQPAPDQTARIITRRNVLVDVADDASQRALIARLTEEGYKCRALNS